MDTSGVHLHTVPKTLAVGGRVATRLACFAVESGPSQAEADEDMSESLAQDAGGRGGRHVSPMVGLGRPFSAG